MINFHLENRIRTIKPFSSENLYELREHFNYVDDICDDIEERRNIFRKPSPWKKIMDKLFISATFITFLMLLMFLNYTNKRSIKQDIWSELKTTETTSPTSKSTGSSSHAVLHDNLLQSVRSTSVVQQPFPTYPAIEAQIDSMTFENKTISYYWQIPKGNIRPKGVVFIAHACHRHATDWWKTTSSSSGT